MAMDLTKKTVLFFALFTISYGYALTSKTTTSYIPAPLKKSTSFPKADSSNLKIVNPANKSIAAISYAAIPIKLCISRASQNSERDESKEYWFSAVLETFYYFIFSLTEQVTVVPRELFSASLTTADPYGVALCNDILLDGAKKTQSAYILLHSYSFELETDSISYSLKILNTRSKKDFFIFKKKFHLNELDKNLIYCVQGIFRTLHVPITTDMAQWLGNSLITNDQTHLMNFGQCCIDAQMHDGIKTATEDILKIILNEPRFSLAVYEVAYLYEKSKNYEQAAQYFNHLIIRNGFTAPQFYVKASKNYRLCNSLSQAEQMIGAAQKKTRQSKALLIEQALLFQRENKTQETAALFTQILKTDPHNSDALLFFISNYEKEGAYPQALKLINKIQLNNTAPLNIIAIEKLNILMAMKKYSEALRFLTIIRDSIPNDSSIFTVAGDVYFANKEYAAAANNYSHAFEKSPQNVLLLTKTSESFRQAHDPQQAFDVLNANKSSFNKSKDDFSRQLGLVWYSMGDTLKAQPLLQTSYANHPKDSTVLMALATISMSKGEIEAAIALFERALQIAKDSLEINLSLAELYLKKKEYTIAEIKLLSIYTTNNNYPSVNKFLGFLYKQNGSDKRALMHLLKERAMGNESEDVQQGIAELYFKLNDFVSAERELIKLVTLNPNNVIGITLLAHIALKKRNIRNAEEYISRAQSLGDINPVLYKDLASILSSTGAHNKAIGAYQKYCAKVSSDTMAWIALAELYTRTHQDSLAACAAMKIFSFSPQKNQRYLIKAGHLFYTHNMKKQAYDAYSLYRGKFTTINTELNYNLATMEFDKKNYPAVIKLLTPLIAQNSEYRSPITTMLALSYYYSGNYPQSLPYLKQTILFNPTNFDLWRMIGTSYETCGQTNLAIAAYQKYIRSTIGDSARNYAFRIANIHENSKQIMAALAQYQRNIASYPDDIRNYEHCVSLNESEKNFECAMSCIIKLLKRPSVPYEYQKKLANLYLKTTQQEKAAVLFEKYCANVPDDYESWYQLGMVYYTLKMYTQACKPLEIAYEQFPDRYDFVKNLGMSYFFSNNPQKAARIFRKATQINSKDLAVLTVMTDCYVKTKDTVNLISILQTRTTLEPDNFSIRFSLGNLLMQADATDKAIQALELASEIRPSDLQTHRILTALYKKKNNKQKQLYHINEALKYFPDDKDLNFEKAEYLVGNHRNEEAKMYLKKTMNLNPQNAKAYFYYGNICYNENNLDAALNFFEAAIKRSPDTMEYLKVYTKTAIVLNKTYEVFSAIDNALQRKPDNPELIEWAGYIYFQLNNYQKAESYLLSSIDNQSNCQFCHKLLGLIYFQHADYDKSIEYIEKALHENDKDDSLSTVLAKIYTIKGESKKALRIYAKIYKRNPKNDETLYYLCAASIACGAIKDAKEYIKNTKTAHKSGWLYLAEAKVLEAEGSYASAEHSYDAALQAMPTSIDAYMGKAQVKIKRNDYDMAIEDFSKVLALQPDNEDALCGLGKAYFSINDLDAAQELSQEAINKNPTFVPAYLLQGTVLIKQEKYYKAIEILQKVLHYNKKNADIYYALGIAYKKSQQHEEALRSFNTALEYDKNKKTLCYEEIGNIYYTLEKDKEAKKYFKKYINAGGTNDTIKTLLQTL